MKTLYELQRFFDDELHSALEQWYDKFTEETGQRGLDLFLAYLAQKQLISSDKLNRLRSGQPVQIAEVESVAAGFVEAATSIANLRVHGETSPIVKAVSLEDFALSEDEAWSGKTPIARLKTPALFALDSTGQIAIEPIEPTDAEEAETGDPEDPKDLEDSLANQTTERGEVPPELAKHTTEIAEADTDDPPINTPIDTPSQAELDAGEEETGEANELDFEPLPTGLPMHLVAPEDLAQGETAYSAESLEGIGFEDTNADDGVAYQATAVLSTESIALQDALKIEDENHSLLGELGRGAMGVVFMANEKNLGRKVAFKQIRPEVATDQELMMRFLREAQITAQLDHPAIIPVHSLVKGFKGLPAYTMKVVEGMTLDVLVKETHACFQSGQQPDEEHTLSTRLEHFLKVCDAMAYAHSKGVLHRDLKPKNILVGRFGEAYIVDWGLARLMFSKEDTNDDSIRVQEMADFGHVKTQVGRLMGTPQYMSPEQAQGLIFDMDGRSDLYSLGVILFELVFLEKALEGENLLDVVNKVVKGDLKEVPNQSPYEPIPGDLPALIRKATSPDKQQRHESVKQFAEALRSCIHRSSLNEGMTASRNAHMSMPAKPTSSMMGWVACLFVVFLALGVGGYLQNKSNKEHLLAQEQQKQRAQQLRRQQLLSHQVGQRIEQFFHLTQAQVGALASAAQLALQNTQRIKRPKFYLNKGFTPPDMQASAFYRESISLTKPVIKLAPGRKPKAVKKQLGRLSMLWRAQRDSLFQSLPAALRNLSLQAHVALLERGDIPLLSTLVALPEGVISHFPGRGSFPTSYNPTKQPWYKAGAGKRGVLWSRPFVSPHKIRTVVIACTRSLFDKHDKFIAIVGGTVRLNTLADALQDVVRPHKWMKKAQLLNEHGQILVKSDRHLQDYTGRAPVKGALHMPVHRSPRLVAAIKKQQLAGTLLLPPSNGKQERLYFVRLLPGKWYFVASADTYKAKP